MANIHGNNKANTLLGTAGDDTIHGAGGNDTIRGGAGLDYLYGDGGADTFVIEAGTNSDVIFDFDRNDGDTIVLDVSGAIAFPAGALSDGQTFTYNGVLVTVIASDQDSDGSDDTYITVDVNSDGIIDHQDVIFVILGYAPEEMNAFDFGG